MAQGKITKDQISDKDPFEYISLSAKDAKAYVDALEMSLKLVKAIAEKTKNDIPKSIPTNNAELKKQNELFERANILAKNKISLETKLKEARKDSIQENVELKVLLQEQNKINKNLAKEKLGLLSAYTKESKRLNDLRRQYKDLILTEGEGAKGARKLRREIKKLDARLKKVDASVGQFQRNVGNYTSAFGKLGSAFKAGLALGGITLGLSAVGRAIGDTFQRIRDFDEKMNNMAGIAGTTRKGLKDVEREIVAVAGSSIKTSNEVAQLATTLFTLGNSKEKVKLLLKPVNDLSIALNATSEDTADFLGQTLNAFGKGAESGQEFADIIANIRSSTSLDFERIKDALGFIAPTAKALNLTIGETGAIIGVLQDNGIKAARAGRLMNTSFARLIDKGLTLDQALAKINKSTDKVSTASELFGSEAFSLGLILADNIDKTAELANEFDNLSEGSLKKLTDEQLKSMDAQIKILDSTYEKFILNIDEGNGIISRSVKGIISALTSFIELLDSANKSYKDLIREVRETSLSENAKEDISEFNEYLKTINKIKLSEKERREEALKFLDVDIKRSNQLKDILIQSSQLNEVQKNELRTLKERTKNGDILTKTERKRLKLLNEIVSKTGKLSKEQQNQANILNNRIIAILNSTKAQDEFNKSTTTTIKKTRELTGLIEKQEKVVSDLNEALKRATLEEEIFSISFDIEFEKKELDRLYRIATSTRAEFEQQQLDLIQDRIDREIEKEKEKSKKLIELVKTNSKTSTKEKEDLIEKEAQRLDRFIIDKEIERGNKEIKEAKDLAEAKFLQRRLGYKSEADFEEAKEREFLGIKRKALEDELKLLEMVGDERSNLRQEQIKAELESLDEFRKGLDIDYELVQKGLELIENLYEEHYNKRIELIEKEGEAHRNNLEEFKRAAREGNITAKESLAEEQQLAIEADRKAEELEKEKQRVLFVTSVLKAYTSELEAGKTPGEALSSAIINSTVLEQFARALPTFIEGTENVGESLGKPQLKGQDGYIIRVDGKERIVDPENNRKMGNISNDEAANIIERYRLGKMMDGFHIIGMANEFNTSSLEEKLNDVKKAIISKPETDINIGEITQHSFMIIEKKRQGNQVTTNRFKVKV